MPLFDISLQKTSRAFVFSGLLLWSFMAVFGATSVAAPVAEQVRARAVQGRLPGGSYSQIWLGVTPEFADAQITVLTEWDRLYPAENGLNFFILDEHQLRRLQEGEGRPLSALALAAGNANFELTTPDNVLGAGLKATGWALYTIVVLNESLQDATFTLRVTNAFILDDSGQVSVLDAAPNVESAPTPLPSPVPTLAFLPTAAVTVGGAISSPVSITQTQPITLLPRPRTGLGQGKRATMVSGVLAGASDHHLLHLRPAKAGGQILLRLATVGSAAQPRENADELNFWVFDELRFNRYQAGADPNILAVTGGKRVFRSVIDERVAGFRAIDTRTYTVVIYSKATLPISYTMGIEGAAVLNRE